MDKIFSPVGAFLPYALAGLVTVEVLLAVKACYLRYQVIRHQVSAAHCVTIEATDDQGSYSVVE